MLLSFACNLFAALKWSKCSRDLQELQSVSGSVKWLFFFPRKIPPQKPALDKIPTQVLFTSVYQECPNYLRECLCTASFGFTVPTKM